MGERGRENYPKIKKYNVDLSEAWDMASQVEVFFREIKKLPFYRSDLLYSGFDGDQIGSSFHSDVGKNIIFCTSEEEMSIAKEEENPMVYAMDYDSPAIAVYDPAKLELAHKGNSENEGYKIKEPAALVAIVVLK